ncbi:Dolichyl-phosphate-mannose-protein mannosyltransferase [Methanolobus vulcani]|uniref:Dolichyl-phosphate-mannose-protein mannosyltransferase n=1 Tax=Methanolobus vulcani TaxID=38026 RepID=A0A7Z7AYW8_9EURY|nr:glycosyltransferase family 39 protein [Methanolobus vulcani]SDF58555.1 Dolichyl-phosphate-mannose-protein mannosyltransferase [Methanolobus vulcani]
MVDIMSKKSKRKSNNAALSNINGAENSALSLKNNDLFSKINFNPSLLILLFVTLLGAYLRLHALGSESIWLDEASTFRMSNVDSISSVWANAIQDRHPPLHFLIIHFITLFSTSEFWIRFPSAVFGILSIPAIYLTAESLFRKREGIISAFILSISVFHIFYSQEARMYSQMMFFSLLTIYFLYRSSIENKKWLWMSFSVSSALAFYSFYYTIFVLIPIGIFYLTMQLKNSFKEKKIVISDIGNVKQFALSIIVFLVLISPLIVPFISQSISRTSDTPTWGMSQSFSFFSSILQQFSIAGTGYYLFLLFFLIGSIFMIKNIDQRDQSLLLGLLFILPFVASFILAGKMPFSSRYLLFILPVYFIVISRGITGVADFLFKLDTGSSKRNETNVMNLSFVVFVLFILLVLSFSSMSMYYSNPQKNDWRSTVDYLNEVSSPGDVIVFLPGYMTQPFKYYYDSDDRIIESASNSEALININSKYDSKIWYVITWDISAANPEGDALAWLNENAVMVNQITGIYIMTNR